MSRNSVSRIFAFLVALVAAHAAWAQGAPRVTGSPTPAPASGLAAVPASSAASAQRPAADGRRSSIATITELAQELKVEQLKRELREAKQAGANAAEHATRAAGGSALLPPAAGLPAPVRVVERTAPGVTAILGIGGRLRARLHDGREVVAGQEVQGWKVNAVTPSAVSFSYCAAPKKAGGKEEPCVTRSVAPSAV